MKKVYILIIILISISLIGIIAVQVMSIKNALILQNEQIEQNIQFALNDVGQEILAEVMSPFQHSAEFSDWDTFKTSSIPGVGGYSK